MNKFQSNIDGLMLKKFNGCLIIGDVHGNKLQFDRAVDFAKSNKLKIVSLGDLVDFGDDVDYVIHTTYELMKNGQMLAVIGNHEYKLNRYFEQKDKGNVTLQIKPCLQKSIDSLNTEVLSQKFKWIYSNMTYSIRFLNNIMVHGAVHPVLLQPNKISGMNILWGRKNRKLNKPSQAHNLCLFGQIDREDPKREDGYPNRIYDWVNEIPQKYTVFCGHDIISKDQPTKNQNTHFMDCGCGKDGKLFGAVLNKRGEFVKYVDFSENA